MRPGQRVQPTPETGAPAGRPDSEADLPRLATVDFAIRGEHIALDSLLKATGLASSGGAAKSLIALGSVQVDGQTERRKTCKLRPGQIVECAGARIRLTAEGLPS